MSDSSIKHIMSTKVPMAIYICKPQIHTYHDGYLRPTYHVFLQHHRYVNEVQQYTIPK